MSQGGLPVRVAARCDDRQRRLARRLLPRVWCRTRQRKGRDHGEVRRHAPSARIPPSPVGVPARRCSAWDNASNNKWLVAGKGALIFNPPSAWAVARRDAPQVAEKLWTHAMPKGPKGRFVSVLPRFQGIWNFSKNKSAAKALLQHVSTREAAVKLVEGGQGYDLPPFVK